MQRERRPDRFEDDGVKYETRPSLWVEPREDWGDGCVELVELPAQNEYFDNIVAYWCPKQPLEAGRAHTYKYRLTWCNEPRIPQNVAAVGQTLTGASTRHPEMRFFNVDFAGAGAYAFPDFELKGVTRGSEHVQLSASAGTIVNAAFRRNGPAGTHRLGFEYKPQDGVREADLRCALVSRGTVVSEVWAYRWSV
jgi:glucans biosynthesis protein